MESVKKFIDERAQHKRQYDRRVNKRLMQTQESKVVSSKVVDVDLVFMKSNGTESEKQDTSSSSGNYLTHIVDVDIRLVNDQIPFAEVQLIAQHNVLANEQQHTEQSEPIYDTYLLLMNNNILGGETIQNAEQYQVTSPLLNTELVKSKEMIEKEKYSELSHRWKPMGRIFKTVGLRWVPTGKIFTDSTTKVDSEPPNGSNDDITNPYKCDQTLNVSVETRGSRKSNVINKNKWHLQTTLQARLLKEKKVYA
ncbi:hypothetical protein Tco_1230140 [Tanacetum coccineum]